MDAVDAIRAADRAVSRRKSQQQTAMGDLWAFVGGRRAEVTMPVNEATRPVLEGFWSLVDFRVNKLKRETKLREARKRKSLQSSSQST